MTSSTLLQQHDYIEMLQSATYLATDIQQAGYVLQSLFTYFDQLLDYDFGLALLKDDLTASVPHYHAKSLEYETHTTIQHYHWKITDLANIEHHLDHAEYVVLDDEQCHGMDVLSDFPTISSGLIIPIMNSGAALGWFLFFSDTPYCFEQSAVVAVLPFARLASGSLKNSRLILTVSQSADELAALYHATSVLFRADNLIDFASQITEVVIRAFDYADCGLMIVDQAKEEIVRVKRAGPEAVQPVNKLMLDGKGLVPKAIRSGQIVYEPDVRKSLDYITGDVRSLCELVVPLKTSQGIIGVLDFQSMRVDAFSGRDQRIIFAFAERVAPALENVLLYDQLRQHAIELEQHVAQRTLEVMSTKEQLETIIRSSPDAIVLLDKHGTIEEANLSWLMMVGCSMQDVINKLFIEFLLEPDQEAFQTALENTITDKLENDITVEIPNQTKGTHIEVEISIAPLIDGRKRGVVCNIRDMTQHKQTERVLREALVKAEELSLLKTNFVTMASHEFRTPLTTIMSSSDIVSRYYERLSAEKVRFHMAKIEREVTYLNSLIDDILLIGRSGEEGFTAKYELVNILKLLDSVIARVKITDDIQHPISVDVAKDCEEFITDEKLLTYILDNLLTNACKYSSSGSPISLQMRLEDDLIITVTDRGIGIPKDDMEFLFESFHRGANVGNIRGTGIGLAIVREALNALRGRINIVSEEDQGTSITVSLPMSAKSMDVG